MPLVGAPSVRAVQPQSQLEAVIPVDLAAVGVAVEVVGVEGVEHPVPVPIRQGRQLRGLHKNMCKQRYCVF